jgi:hypothetical protein
MQGTLGIELPIFPFDQYGIPPLTAEEGEP